jgi:hypothetical protein
MDSSFVINACGEKVYHRQVPEGAFGGIGSCPAPVASPAVPILWMRKFGLAPVIDDKTEILILGTLPSDVSLAKRIMLAVTADVAGVYTSSAFPVSGSHPMTLSPALSAAPAAKYVCKFESMLFL